MPASRVTTTICQGGEEEQEADALMRMLQADQQEEEEELMLAGPGKDKEGQGEDTILDLGVHITFSLERMVHRVKTMLKI